MTLYLFVFLVFSFGNHIPLPTPPPNLSDKHVFNKRDKKPDGKENIYIGRPGRFQNPYTVNQYGRSKAIALFEIYLIKSGLINDISVLKDKNLICSCSPSPCHGDVIAKYLYQ